jgi:hypothetical protein
MACACEMRVSLNFCSVHTQHARCCSALFLLIVAYQQPAIAGFT